jgi:flagellar protein FliS
MRVHFKALESYSTGSTASQAAVANRVELIQMLFDGLIDSLSAARGHIEHKAIEEKSKSLARAGRIREVYLAHDRHYATSSAPDGVFCVHAPC